MFDGVLEIEKKSAFSQSLITAGESLLKPKTLATLMSLLVDVMGDVTDTPLLNAPRSVMLSGVSGWPDRAVPSKPSI